MDYYHMEYKRNILAMWFSALCFASAAILLLIFGNELSRAMVIGALLFGGYSQYAFQDKSRRAQITSIIAAYISFGLIIVAYAGLILNGFP